VVAQCVCASATQWTSGCRNWRLCLRERIANDRDLLYAGGHYYSGSADQQDQDSQREWLDRWCRSRIRNRAEFQREAGVPVSAIWPRQQKCRRGLHRTWLQLRARNDFHEPQQRRAEYGAAGCQLELRRPLRHFGGHEEARRARSGAPRTANRDAPVSSIPKPGRTRRFHRVAHAQSQLDRP
jgi:hypothetical protein